MRALYRIPRLLLAPGLLLALACSTDKPGTPTAPPTNPIPPAAGVNVAVTASAAELEVSSTSSSLIRVRATRADNGAALPNLTPVALTTTLGGFGSLSGPANIGLELVNGEASVPFFAGDTIGSASIRAAVSSGVGFATVIVRGAVDPEVFFLSSVSPNTGSPQGGETVTIHGGGFSDPIRVTFNGVPATIQSASATQIRVTTPPLLSGLDPGATLAVTVTVIINLNEEGQQTDSLASGFTYVNGGGGGGTLQPTIFSITPASGPNEGGTQVTINGDGFEAPVQVKFGTGTSDTNFNGAEAQVISVTRTRVVVISPPTSCATCAPPIPNQLVNILVKNQNTSRFTVATSAFRYGARVIITSIAPGQGSIYGGELVTLFGQGFDEPVAVAFGGFSQQVMSVSGSEVVVLTTHPGSCPSGALASTLVNIETGDTGTGPGYLYLKPNIFSISPSSGPQGGGTAVTVSGANFGLPIIVDFTASGTKRAGTVTAASTSTISVITPSMPDAAMRTEECDVDADLTLGTRFTSTPATVTVTDPVSGCSDTFEGSFLFTPTSTTCVGD